MELLDKVPGTLVGRHAGIGMGQRGREAIDIGGRHAQHLAHLARGTAPPIGDDIGRHGGPVRSVFVVHVLNDPLALRPARQVEIDVGPFTALFREKPLEQQLHADRIDRRDAEAVADSTVGRRSAPLHQDVVLPTEIHNVPDDEEVAGEVEGVDETELPGNLRTRPVVIGLIAMPGTDLDHAAEEPVLGLAMRHGIAGKPVAQIVHGKLQPLGQIEAGLNGLGAIGKQPRHLRGCLEEAFGIGSQATPGRLEGGVRPDAGEHVVERALGRGGVAHAAGGHQRHAERLGQ